MEKLFNHYADSFWCDHTNFAFKFRNWIKDILKGRSIKGNNFLSNNTNKSSNLNLTSEELLTSIGNFVNSTFGLNLTNSQATGFISQILSSLYISVDILASLVFLVGIFGITYAMDINLVERRREIALLKLMGFTTFQVAATHLLEAALLGFLGAIVGSYSGCAGHLCGDQFRKNHFYFSDFTMVASYISY